MAVSNGDQLWRAWRGGGGWAGSRKVTSSARSRLANSESLQSKSCVIFGATKMLLKPGVYFRINLLEPGAKRASKYQKILAPGAKMWLQEPRCGCKTKDVAAGAKMWLLEPNRDCWSQNGVAGAKMWLLEPICGCRSQDMAAGALMWLHEPMYEILVKSSFLLFCRNFCFL